MKKTLFLTALLCTVPQLHAAVGDTLNLIVDNAYSTNGFIAEDVKGDNGYFYGGNFSANIQTATRFYDSTKNWSEIKNNSAGDSRMCWAHTAGNMIQYWQSYYGVFYKGNNGELPYGTDYNRTINPNLGASYTITDPMRLNTTKQLITVGFNQKDEGGNVYAGTDFYFCRNKDGGGYFKEYFGSYNDGVSIPDGTTATVTKVTSQETLTPALLSAMGITKQTDGTYKQSEAGLIAHLNVGADEGQSFSAHTLTCYGFTLDESGNIKSLVYADSDNYKLSGIATSEGIGNAYGGLPTLEQAYVKVENNKVMLYTDSECETPLTYGTDNHYYLGAVTQINTPEVLKNMLAEYSDAENEAQIWNGKDDTWESQVENTNELPTESTGWDINVNGSTGKEIANEHQGYYHTYSTDGRDVVFGSHGMKSGTGVQEVTVTGAVTPGAITVKDGGNYYLKAGNNAAIDGNGDVSIEANSKLSSEVNFGSRTIAAKNGAHFAYAMGSDTMLSGKISGESGSTVQFRNRGTQDITYTAEASTDRQNNTVNSLQGTLIVGDANDSHATHLDFSEVQYGYLTVENLVMYNNTSLDTTSSTKVTDTFSSLKNLQAHSSFDLKAAATTPQIKDSLDLSSAKTIIMETAVDISNNTLTLGASKKSLTLDTNSIQMNGDGKYTFDLFTNVGTLKIGSETLSVSSGDEWTITASDYFTGANITDETLLVFDGGVVQLRGLSIPEPGSATLSLLALAALAGRRRRL